MGDPLTTALRALHAAGVIRSWVRPGMRLVDDEAVRSYMVVMLDRDGGLWLSEDDSIDDPGDPEWFDGQEPSAFRVADDDVTTAALLPIVREAWRDGDTYCAPADGWYVNVNGRVVGEGALERDALTAALVARAERLP